MELQQTIEPIAARLTEALSAREVPPHYQEWGARLLDHLRRPVRIVVTGLPGSGKSSLINMLLSRQIISGCEGIPVLDIAYGPEARVRIELEDGTMRTRTGVLADIALPERVIRVRQELPERALEGQSYRELNLGGSPEVSRRILSAAMSEADIVLWCTSGFGAEERAIWSGVPDGIKDHGFLVVTRADRQMMRGVLTDTIRALEPIVDEEFFGLFPVATLQAMTALTGQREPDRRLWMSSGGQTLSEAIERQVASGRAADIDQAQMLLTQCGAGGPEGTAAAAPAEADAAEAPPVPAAPEPAGQGQATDAARPARAPGDILGEAVQILTRSGQELLREIEGEGDVDTDLIMTRCAETIGALTSQLQGSLSEDGAVLDAQESAREGEEMLMLFQLERGEDAALDAVTMMLQLRKEMSARETA